MGDIKQQAALALSLRHLEGYYSVNIVDGPITRVAANFGRPGTEPGSLQQLAVLGHCSYHSSDHGSYNSSNHGSYHSSNHGSCHSSNHGSYKYIDDDIYLCILTITDYYELPFQYNTTANRSVALQLAVV